MNFAIPRGPRATTTSRATTSRAAILAMAIAAVEFAAAGTAPGPGQGLREE